MEIESDPAKAATNRVKHGVSFADVEPAFFDELALSMQDPFAVAEERYVTVGRYALGRVVTVLFVYRGENIRIDSARRATGSERRHYEKGLRPR